MLARDGLAAPVRDTGRDNDLCLSTRDAAVERCCTKAAEHDTVDRPNPGTGEHRDDLLRDHRHIDRDPVSFLNTQLFQTVGHPHDFTQELAVGKDPPGVILAFPYRSNLIPAAILHIAVKAVVSNIGLTINEPACIWMVPFLHF
jgi:hypothetical protein